jgi:hypothetical protein
VSDLHSVYFTSKTLETRMMNLYLAVRKAVVDNVQGIINVTQEEKEDEEKEELEDDVMEEGK